MKRLAAAASLLACLAWADIPPRNTETCRSAKAGDNCKTDGQKAGTCVKQMCSRNDYSDGPPPKQVVYGCLVCRPLGSDGGPQP